MSTKITKGFTLIELLLVVLLMGILSGVLLGVINVNGLRQKTRDSQRISDLKKIQVALELYFADNRTYPASDWDVALGALGGNTLKGYLNTFPADPNQNGSSTSPCVSDTSRDYWYRGSSSRYIIATNMEVTVPDTKTMCIGLNSWAEFDDDGITPLACGTPLGNCYGVENTY